VSKALIIVLSCILLSACGAKGALKLPNSAPKAPHSKQDAKKTEPQAARVQFESKESTATSFYPTLQVF